QPASQVEFLYGRATPVDHLGCEHAADADLLAESGEHDVDPGRVHVGQLGQVADAHHQLGIGVSAADLQVATERGREPEGDRLDDRVDAEFDPRGAKLVDSRFKRIEVGRRIRDGDDFGAESLVPPVGQVPV